MMARDPAQFGERAVPVRHVVQHVVGHRPVRDPVRQRKRRRVARHQRGGWRPAASGGQHPGRHVDTQQPAAMIAAGQFGQVEAIPALDVP
jgi:hypothetical protein